MKIKFLKPISPDLFRETRGHVSYKSNRCSEDFQLSEKHGRGFVEGRESPLYFEREPSSHTIEKITLSLLSDKTLIIRDKG